MPINETPDQTVARAKEMLAKLEANGGKTTNERSAPTIQSGANPLLDALISRLTTQGEGISSSSSTNLQASIDQAIAGTQQAGALGSQALESQRQRELAFAQDRASATITGAMEGRSGYATQVVALRELTDTTEKSIRDLDMRYKEAIMTNDSNTASEVAGLRMQKLQFLQQQEQNFYNNLFQAANLTQQQLQMQQQSEQFWTNQQTQADQFAQQMAQSDYQFEKNLGLQYQEFGLKEQELELAKERNQIAWAEYSARKDELNKGKNFTTTQGLVQQRLMEIAKAGGLENVDPLTIAGSIRAELEGSGFSFDGSTEDFSTIVMQSYLNVKAAGIAPASSQTSNTRTGGLFGEGSVGQAAGQFTAGFGQSVSNLIFGTPANQTLGALEEQRKQRADFYSTYLPNPLIK